MRGNVALVESLAQIRLNPTSVEQFLSIACSLADDNPATIRGQVYEAAKEARSAAALIDHLRNLFSHQQQSMGLQLAGGGGGGSQRQQQQQQQPDTQFLFTYSNQLTLYKAAKCLVANVAKILFLADSVVLFLSSAGQQASSDTTSRELREHHKQQQQQQQQQQYPELNKPDRLDNVANYSQLLRSFGELSADLVDLGLCIMLGQQQQQQPQRQRLPLSADQEFLAGQLLHPDEPTVAAAGTATTAATMTTTTSSTGATSATTATTAKPNSSSLANQIQDMQTLFQVNRLIIDRSILLLLSTSKCCLRLAGSAPDCLRSLEARRQSVLVQIRASVSVIMAIVKCSVFSFSSSVAAYSPAASASSSSAPASSFAGAAKQPPPPSRHQFDWCSGSSSLSASPPGPSLGQARSLADQWLRAADSQQQQHETLWQSASDPTGAGNALAGAHSLGGALSPNAISQQDYYLRYLLAACQSPPPPPPPLQLGDHLNSRRPAQRQMTSMRAGADAGPNNNKPAGQPEQPLQIMNYFLQTWNGTQSAHDAINNLQSLVKPISQVASFKSLIFVLNGIFAAHFARKHHHHHHHQHHHYDQPANQSAPLAWQQQLANGTQSGLMDRHADDIDHELATAAAADDADKENHHLSIPIDGASSLSSTAVNATRQDLFMCMEKRLLISTLNSLFLDEIKVNLIERAHEFTDCAYTKHEHREDILMLLQCVRFQLNKLVKILYKCRKKASLGMSELHLDQLRQVSSHIDESCQELKHELQTVVIEQSDELDRTNCQLDLMKQMKHNCLMGDLNRCQQTNAQFNEQSEQLIEICKMLNQIAPTNKMKITTKTLAIWFELNLRQLLDTVACLCENPSSRELKDCTWAYLQAWCSFYDDFCQLARQVAYLTHAHYDSERSARVAGRRDQLMLRAHQNQQRAVAASGQSVTATAAGEQHRSDYRLDVELRATTSQSAAGELIGGGGAGCGGLEAGDSPCGSLELMLFMPDVSSQEACTSAGRRQLMASQQQQQQQQQQHWAHQQQPPHSLQRPGRFGAASEANQQHLRAQSARELELSHASSIEQPLNIMHRRHQQAPISRGGETPFGPGACSAASVGANNDSPRSLDHYYGFGANYHRRAHVHPAGTLPQLEEPLPPPQQYQRGLLHEQPAAHLGSFSPSESHHRNLRQQQQQQQQQQHHHQRAHYLCGPPPLETGCLSPGPPADYCAGPPLLYPVADQRPARQRYPGAVVVGTNYEAADESVIRPPVVAPRRAVTIDEHHREVPLSHPAGNHRAAPQHQPQPLPPLRPTQTTNQDNPSAQQPRHRRRSGRRARDTGQMETSRASSPLAALPETSTDPELSEQELLLQGRQQPADTNSSSNAGTDQQSMASGPLEPDGKWSDSDADAIVRGAKETAQMALSMYQFTKGEGDLNTTQDLFTQAELFAEEANELYKEVRCFSYKVPAGDLKKELLNELGNIPALVQQLQFIVKNPTVGKPATFAKVDSVIRETKLLMEAVNRVVTATLSCRQHYNMAIASMRKRTRMLSPSYRNDKGFEFENHSSARQSAIGGRHGTGAAGAGGMGSEPDI